MPRRATSIRTDRASKKKHLRNVKVKVDLKKTLKKFQAFLTAKNLDESKTMLKKVFSQMDKAAKKGIIHPNTVSRKKSRLSLKLRKSA
jgi:small subunit ribosomal protein S20